MGITEEELQARVKVEVDSLLCGMKAEREWERIVASSSSDSPRVLSKEDCMTLFRATGVPPPGPLWGVYRWAADLGITHFNFEGEGSDYSYLDAYD